MKIMKILKTFRLSEVKSKGNLVFMYANSGQNKLHVNQKEKKLTPTDIREKNLVSRQFMCMCSNNKTVFIKNDICILKSILRVAARMSFVFISRFMKKTCILISRFSG